MCKEYLSVQMTVLTCECKGTSNQRARSVQKSACVQRAERCKGISLLQNWGPNPECANKCVNEAQWVKSVEGYKCAKVVCGLNSSAGTRPFKVGCGEEMTAGRPEAAQKGVSLCKVERKGKSRRGTSGSGCQDGDCAETGVGAR